MARRQRKDSFEERVGALVGFIGLVIVAAFYAPGFRALLSGVFLLILMALGITLGVLIIGVIISHFRKKQEAYAATYLAGKVEPIDRQQIPTDTIGILQTPARAEAQSQPLIQVFSQELLDALEWRRVEQLVTWYFQKTGFEARRSRVGADGGVDIHLYKRGESRPFAYVQCKAWHVYTVGVKPVRELFGVMAAGGVGTGYFVTTGRFTAEAQEFVTGKDLKLVTGDYLLEKLNSLPESDRLDLLYRVNLGDYTTPTCPRCDIKMVRRTGSDGDFWGCPNFPKRPSCRQTFKMRAVRCPVLDLDTEC